MVTFCEFVRDKWRVRNKIGRIQSVVLFILQPI